MQERRILRMPEVMEITGLSKTTINRFRRDNRFPTPVKLGRAAIGWRSEDVQAWLDGLETATYLPYPGQAMPGGNKRRP